MYFSVYLQFLVQIVLRDNDKILSTPRRFDRIQSAVQNPLISATASHKQSSQSYSLKAADKSALI
jgi:hypothetical protein